MEQSPKIQGILSSVVCCLFIVLFTYAAVSKLIDFTNFQVQLGQSPLLSAFAIPISVLVPVTEILIIVTLIVPALRLFGLFASYTLMVLFTAYIYILLNYSPYIPCSCGGILEKMSWSQHLAFNVIFILLAGLGIFSQPSGRTHFKRIGHEA